MKFCIFLVLICIVMCKSFLLQARQPAVWQLKTEEFPKVPLSQEPEEEPGAGQEGEGREGR